MQQLKYMIMSVLVVLITAVPVLAQSDEDVIGVVTGQILNQTDTDIVPDGVDVMLHAWDQDFNEKIMLNGQSEADGTFQFDDVTMNPEWLYAVMLTYQDVLYYSEPAPLSGDLTSLTIDVPIYETTTDTSQVQIERQHIFFDTAQGGLMVGEVYILSNSGDKTIAGAGGDDGTLSPLQFSLPEDATGVSFEGAGDGRFLLTPGGFVDTAPLRPGAGSSQIVVRYVLPYTDGMPYAYTAQWPVNEINFLVPESLGLSLSADNLTDEGLRDLGNGEKIGIFSYGSLNVGESLAVTLSGALVSPPVAIESDSQAAESAAQPDSQAAIAIGIVVLGLAFIGVGFWWYRQPDEAEELEAPVDDVDFKELVTQIALLDEAHDRGEIAYDVYEAQRSALRHQAQLAMAEAD
ncbi:MAG: hypothetical protein ACE5FD_03235 [Anaerolineae bacterium]